MPLMLRRITILLALGLMFQASAVAQPGPDFPELTGRVVDQADMLPKKVEASLSQMLEAHEQSTTEQVVVVTLPDLQGHAIEDYGYQLGRHWGIGQEGEDNGALLIVAEDERRIRIEVGYGLEGRLTDATSSTIINQIITPAFRQGDFATGIANGAAAMVQVLGGEPLAVPESRGTRAEEGKPHPALGILFFIIVLLAFFGSGRRGRSAILAGALLGGLGGGRGGGFGGGGFGGGGGGFGGGGASGGW